MNEGRDCNAMVILKGGGCGVVIGFQLTIICILVSGPKNKVVT